MTTRNYYEVLGLAPGADGAMVDQAYWHLAKTYQQLAPSDPRAEYLLDELNDAYGVLGTPRLRQEYDLGLRAGQSGQGRLVPRDDKPHGLRIKLPRPRFPFRHEKSDKDASQSPTVIAASSRVNGRDKAQDLRASTAAMLERWRSNAGIQPADAQAPEPDMTLVDIFRTEKELAATPDDPLTSVMDVLRRAKSPAPVE
jgi:curved DNA-binding protein CbpA